MGTESCTDGREMVVKREVASPTSGLSGSAAEDDEHSATHNKALNSEKTNLKIKIKMEDKSKCLKCLVSLKISFYMNITH